MDATIVFQKNWEAIHALNEDGTRRYKYIINTGSSRSSKTGSLIQCCDLYGRSQRDKRITVWRDTKKDCKDTVLNDAIRYFKMWGTYKVQQTFHITESIFTYGTGSTFEIHGTDDEEKVMGLNKAVAWLNEPYKISRDTFDQIDQRTEDFILIDWNPKKNHWIDDLTKDPRAIVIHSTFKDNPFCPIEQKIKILSYQPVSRCDIVVLKLLTDNEAKGYDYAENPQGFTQKQIKELIRCRENEANNTANDFNWCVYGLGLKGERPNRIFHWKPISLEDYRKLSVPTYYATDWGTVDPWGIIEVKYYDNRLYVHQLNYKSENQIRQKLTATELIQINTEEDGIVSWMFKKLGIAQGARIVCDTNRPQKIAILRRHGYGAMPASKGSGSIIDGIDLLNNLTEIHYTSCSEDLEYEQENYSRKVDKFGIVEEEPEDVNNHLIDCVRYASQDLVSLGIIKRM